MPPWTQHVDVHCERHTKEAGPETVMFGGEEIIVNTAAPVNSMFGPEPINIYSIAAYLMAAFFAYQFGKNRKILDQSTVGLVQVMGLVAVCGFIFHLQANVWSMYLDSIPIYAFQILFVYSYGSFMARNTPNPQITAIFITVGFVILNLLASLVPYSILNGAATFIPMLIFMVIFAYYHNHNVRRNTAVIWLSVIAWIIAIFMKSIDIEACDYQSFGTHSIWHVTSAAAMLFAIIGLLSTKEDGRHLRSLSVDGHWGIAQSDDHKAQYRYKFEKIEAVESLNPHDVVRFEEPTLSITRPDFLINPIDNIAKEPEEKVAKKRDAKETQPKATTKQVVKKDQPKGSTKRDVKKAKPKTATKQETKRTRPETATKQVTKKARPKAATKRVVKKDQPKGSTKRDVKKTKPKTATKEVTKRTQPNAATRRAVENARLKIAKKEVVKKKVAKKGFLRKLRSIGAKKPGSTAPKK